MRGGDQDYGQGNYESHNPNPIQDFEESARNGMRTISGPINLPSGAIYTGEWLNGARDGRGK